MGYVDLLIAAAVATSTEKCMIYLTLMPAFCHCFVTEMIAFRCHSGIQDLWIQTNKKDKGQASGGDPGGLHMLD